MIFSTFASNNVYFYLSCGVTSKL